MSRSRRYTKVLLCYLQFAKCVSLQLQEAVTTAHETSDAFSDETLREQAIFQYAKEAEMKEMLGSLADGHIDMYKQVC